MKDVIMLLSIPTGWRGMEFRGTSDDAFVGSVIGAILLLLMCGVICFLVKRSNKEFKDLLEFMKGSVQ